MRCPQCGIECRVQAGEGVIRFFCRNKQCPNYSPKSEKEVGHKIVKEPE